MIHSLLEIADPSPFESLLPGRALAVPAGERLELDS